MLLVCGRLSAVPAAAEGLAEQAVEPLAAVLEEARARDMTAWMVSIRRKLHRMPELMYSEHATSQLVRCERTAAFHASSDTRSTPLSGLSALVTV